MLGPATAVVLVCRHVSDMCTCVFICVCVCVCVCVLCMRVDVCVDMVQTRSPSLCVVPCAPVNVSVTTILYQNNSVYGVELFWTHRQVIIDCCGVVC